MMVEIKVGTRVLDNSVGSAYRPERWGVCTEVTAPVERASADAKIDWDDGTSSWMDICDLEKE